jgi:asparagine synthase (glutamine-hydrolysing)
MCGICGMVAPLRVAAAVTEDRVRAMRDTMVHRGPDAAGLWLGRGAGLGHQRLSIVDVAGGHQPMATPDGRYCLVYNGEVYNHPALKRELERTGHQYVTRCDTETVLQLVAREGLEGVRRFRGMFAFGLWDEHRRRLLLVRDRLGIKPLYYVHASDGTLFFASEIKALLAGGAVSASLNFGVLPDYLANHAPSGEETLFQGVRRLPPGHALTWENGQIRLERYWQLSFEKSSDRRTDDALIEEFLHRFRESVQLRLMADVPLGAFLSGGIDSTAITAIMSEMVDEPIRTFSVAFAEREANELEYARLAARAYGTDHHEVVLTPERFFGALADLVWHEDEPIAHPSSVALYFVSALAAEHVKVVLTGEGSDELLAGYGRYWKTLLNLRFGRAYERAVPATLRRVVARSIRGVGSRSALGAKLGRTFLAVPADARSLYLNNFAVFSSEGQADLLTHEAREQGAGSDPYLTLAALLSTSGAADLLDTLLEVDLRVYLHELLMKQDQMSMAASIESRVPFLDHQLVEFAASLPVDMKLRGRTTKYVLRKAVQGIVPPQILNRPKAGFPVPLSRWFRGRFRSVVHEHVLSERAVTRGLFQPATLRRLVAEHESGRADHAQRLWSLINFEVWQRLHLDGETADTVLAPAIAQAG